MYVVEVGVQALANQQPVVPDAAGNLWGKPLVREEKVFAINMFDSRNAIYTIRPALEVDAGELARLFTLLGFPTNAGVILAQWKEWKATGNLAFVAESVTCTLIGGVTLHQMTVLHRPRPVGRITALVVDTSLRGQGIGRALVAAAEETLTASGCGLLEITSNMRLAEAHAFYERLGYERTSIRLAKVLTPADS